MTDDRTKQWYIVNTYSGFENKVKESLEQRVQEHDLVAAGERSRARAASSPATSWSR